MDFVLLRLLPIEVPLNKPNTADPELLAKN
jgi:hypothetical protein